MITRKPALSSEHLIFLQKLRQLDLAAINYKLIDPAGQTYFVNKLRLILNKLGFIALVDNILSTYSVYLILKKLYIRIRKLDVFALMHPEEGKVWTKKTQTLLRYMVFLFLLNLYPNQNLVPTVQIDRVWHHHTLGTQKYAQECEELFGRFIYHSPCAELGNDAINSQASFSETQKLFKQYFGVELLAERTQNLPTQCKPFNKSKTPPRVYLKITLTLE
ncbi:MAG: glycine-rich domain-containing protein-like [Okeania sp. SIO2D1]|nr:glycine-rich domain-containing protein-like [Okeania sp. SIO2D1]